MTPDDRIRGFPSFPPGRRPRRGRSWWGDAWVRAVEESSLDQNLLIRARRFAHGGHVGSITVSPGRIAAAVHDSDPLTPRQARVFMEPLTDAQWGRFLDEVAARAGHIAALADHDMPRELVGAAADAGVPLLPGPGDLQAECDCPEWLHPCRHAAALCYQAAWLLDADPFILLLMRGRGEREIVADLQRRQVTVASQPGAAGHLRGAGTRPAGGVPAEQAYAVAPVSLPDLGLDPPDSDPPADTDRFPIPARADGPIPARAGGPSGPAMALPAVPGVRPDALHRLTDWAAQRAASLLAHDWTTGPTIPTDRWRDSVRIAAAGADDALLRRLAAGAGRSVAQLDRAATAWRYDAAAGLDVLITAWSPPRAELARAVDATATGWVDIAGGSVDDGPPQTEVWRNRCTLPAAGLQLRYGRDGRWYPYRSESGRWWPAGPSRPDPAAALADLIHA